MTRSLGTTSMVAIVVLISMTSLACSGNEVTGEADADSTATASVPVGEPDADTGAPDDRSPDGQPHDTEPAVPDEPKPEPQPYVPVGQPGTAQAYDELVDGLQPLIPAALQNQVPWPDLRNPNPIIAQQQIFEMWIWMAEFVPEPELVAVLAAPGSPSREEVAGLFAQIKEQGVLRERVGNGYRAYEHTVVTFESAGLPLWLAQDVPEDAVIVYYSDDSGPVDVTDRETGEPLYQESPTPTRRWLSIMVPTDVGWQLYRDQLIDSSRGLETPDVPPPPSTNPDRPRPEI